MPTIGTPGFALLLGIALTAVGLGIATMFRCIEFEGVGAFLGAVVGLTVGGWAMSFLLSFILPDSLDPRLDSGWGRFCTLYGASLVINTGALAVTSRIIDGIKIRGFFGLLAAAVVVTVVENIIVLTQLARVTL